MDMTIAYGAGMFLGARLFKAASDRTFRIISYTLIACTAVVTVPVEW